MAMLGYDRYLSELVAESDQFADVVRDSGPAAAVPGCPGWTVGTLAEHLGQVHRWAHAIVARRATTEIPDADVCGSEEWTAPGEPGERDTWLRVGARRLAAAITDAGPHTPVWTWDENHRCAGYWARRMVHETVVHRADAAGAAGEPFTAPPDLAADNVSEVWEIAARTAAAPAAEGQAPGAAAGTSPDGAATLGLHAVDEGLGPDGAWLIGPDAAGLPHCRQGTAATAATGDASLHGRAVDLMLIVNRRVAYTDRDVELRGDPAVLAHWLGYTRL